MTLIRLAWPLAKRDVIARYRGTLAGVAWALLAPLAMVLVYTLVFRGVFQARWGTGGADGYAYVARLFAGLMFFLYYGVTDFFVGFETGAAPDELNYRNWSLTDAGLLISFDPYQVGPYAAGPQEIAVPYADLAVIIDPAGPAGAFMP